jgi:hypothetical protein
LANRIGPIIADFGGSFVDLLAALIAKPFEVIDFAGFPFALENNKPRVRLKPGRMGYTRGAEQDLAGFDVSRVFFASFIAVNEMLHAGELQGDFIRRVDMKIPAFFAAAAQKGNRLRILPQHSPGFAFGFDFIDGGSEIDRNEFFHNASRTFQLHAYNAPLSLVKQSHGTTREPLFVRQR